QTPANVAVLEMDLATTLRNVERQLIVDALDRANGVQRKAAKLLGVTERVLWYKIKKLEIEVGSGSEPEGMDDLEEDVIDD
ncbi:MAG TPA: helix-turn-helix domain-containing protein, partial [Terriglobia bacterium]|nr:helix-turn-helix domain-containing protein [Terriglobia bacterium]